MPFLSSLMVNDFEIAMRGKGSVGENLSLFSNAIGNGSVLAMTGKTFNTLDTGSGPSAGVGVGTGLTGFNSAIASDAMYQGAVSRFGQAGSNLKDITDSIASSLANQMPLASLLSNHLPVYAGTGTIIAGSIAVIDTEWSANIKQIGISSGFLGDQWGNFCDAVGEGCVQAFSTVTGSVTITGSPPPTPSPVPPTPNTIIPSGVMT